LPPLANHVVEPPERLETLPFSRRLDLSVQGPDLGAGSRRARETQVGVRAKGAMPLRAVQEHPSTMRRIQARAAGLQTARASSALPAGLVF